MVGKGTDLHDEDVRSVLTHVTGGEARVVHEQPEPRERTVHVSEQPLAIGRTHGHLVRVRVRAGVRVRVRVRVWVWAWVRVGRGFGLGLGLGLG